MEFSNQNSCPVQMRFAVPYFDVFDPRFPDHGVPVAVRGTISFTLQQSSVPADLQEQIRSTAVRCVKDLVANAPEEYSIPVLHLERKTDLLSKMAEAGLTRRLAADFGACVTGVDLNAIEIDRACDEYRMLMAVTRDIVSDTVQARAEAALQKMMADAEDYVEQLRINREENQYERHMQTRSANLAAYQAGLQAEMAMTPPPLPVIAYHVAVDGQDAGLFDAAGLRNLAREGKLTAKSLVWKPGMAAWAPAGSVAELDEYLK